MSSPPLPRIQTVLTYHVEGDLETPSAVVFDEVAAQVRLADGLGYHAAWFAEHHFHVHRGHLPNPLLFAVHLAARTERIHLGSAVITTALHHPLRLAEDLLVADVLSGGRMSIGLGSGSTPAEFSAFGVGEADREPDRRHRRFAEGLEVLEQAWRGEAVSVHGEFVHVEAPPVLPRAIRPLGDLLWIAANSASQAAVAGERGYGIMLSRERGPGEMERIVHAYHDGRTRAGLDASTPEMQDQRGCDRPHPAASPGAHLTPGGRIAASRPVYVGAGDAAAREEAAPAVHEMVARQRRERPQLAGLPPPADFDDACRRVQFVAGGPERVAQAVHDLYAQVPFTALHIQPRWSGLAPAQVEASIRRFQEEVMPRVFAA